MGCFSTSSHSPVYSKSGDVWLSRALTWIISCCWTRPLSWSTTSLTLMSPSRHCSKALVVCLHKVYYYWIYRVSKSHQIQHCTSVGPWQYTCQVGSRSYEWLSSYASHRQTERDFLVSLDRCSFKYVHFMYQFICVIQIISNITSVLTFASISR